MNGANVENAKRGPTDYSPRLLPFGRLTYRCKPASLDISIGTPEDLNRGSCQKCPPSQEKEDRKENHFGHGYNVILRGMLRVAMTALFQVREIVDTKFDSPDSQKLLFGVVIITPSSSPCQTIAIFGPLMDLVHAPQRQRKLTQLYVTSLGNAEASSERCTHLIAGVYLSYLISEYPRCGLSS
jgi:hypothetical protein